MKLYFPLLIVSILFLYGCGNTSTKDDLSLNKYILLDSAITGVCYECGEDSGITGKEGEFFCQKGSVVEFSVGNVYLGGLLLTSNDLYVTPADLYGLQRTDIFDKRVMNFVQFVQSLDNDGDPSNGIEVDESTRNVLREYYLDLSDENVDELDIERIILAIGKQMISRSKALDHYAKSISTILHVAISPSTEPLYSQQWYLDYNDTVYTSYAIDENASIHASFLPNIYTGKGVKIAIIDDGLDVNHEDLQGAIATTYSIVSNTSNLSLLNSDSYHGTAVTGIIGARVNAIGIEGIANGADIIFLQYKAGMSDSETIELFNKAEELGADIINCSWGTYDVSLAVKEKIQELAINGRDGKGIVIVFAAGNDNREMGNDESAIPEVIAVGSTDKDNLRAWYSNYGKNLDIVAPGGYDIGITTLDPMDDQGVGVFNKNYLLMNDPNSFIGTSASAPIVSGTIALLLEQKPDLTREEIENILKRSCDKIGEIPYENGKNDYYGYGKINLQKVLQQD